MAIKDHFTLIAWHDYRGHGEFQLARIRLDWYRARGEGWGWLAIDLSLIGLNTSLTFWPKGKYAPAND